MSKALATKNVAAVLLGLGMIVSAFAFATPASAQTMADLQAQINALLAQIAALQGGGSQQVGGLNCTATFTQNLKSGSTGGEVMAVQKFLNSVDGTQVATTGAGSPGNETSYFGPATKAAVIKFQNKYAADILTPVGLTAGNGNWYSSTRAKANALCAAAPTTPTTPTTPGTAQGTLNVFATAQPANSLAPEGASRVPFTNFTLTNTSNAAVVVNGVTVQRTGFAQNAVFSGVVLVDSNGQQIGTSRTFDSNNQATIGETFTINPGQSMTFTVAGNMSAVLDSYAGQVAGLSVVGINTSSTVTGSLPITGASQVINATLSIGTATVDVSSLDPQTAQTKNIGDTAVRLSGVRVTAGSAEDVKLFSLRWRVNGSAGSADISNVMTNINGVAYPTTISSDGRYYTTTISGGLLLAKGMSIDAYVQADITGSNASGRTIQFDIDRAADIYIVGQTYGYGITATGIGPTAVTTGSEITSGQPFFSGAVISVTGASVTTIGRATEVPAQNVAVNVPGQTLGGFVTDLRGEGVTVNTMVFNVATSSGSGAQVLLTNVTLVNQSGAVVAGPVDAVASGASSQTITFNNAVTLPIGRNVYTLKGTVPTGATTGATFQVETDPSDDWTGVTGQNTGNTVSLDAGSFTMNTVTVRGAALNISASPTPAAQTIVAGGQNVTLANINLDASQSGEDVRVNSLPVRFVSSVGAGATGIGALSSCQVYNGATALNTGSNVLNTVTNNAGATANNITFDNALTVPKGTVVTLTVKCNVSSAAANAGTYTVGIAADDDVTYSATGVQSGTALVNETNLTASAGVSGVQTVGASAITVTTDASAPSFTLVSGGTTGATVNAMRFRATGEAASLTEIGLSTGTSDAAQSDIVRATIWNGATQVGSVIFTGGTVATSTLSTPVTLPADTDVTLTIKVDAASVGSGQSGTGGNDIDIEFSGARATGLNSGTTVYASGSTSAAGVRLERSYPTVALQTLPTTGVADGRLIRFSIAANSNGSIGVQEFNFSLSTSTVASVTNLILYAYSDSGFSNPVSGAASGQLNGTAGSAPTGSVSIATDNVTGGVLQVPAGQTYYFELRGTVAGVETGTSVTTRLLGDTSGTNAGATSSLTASNFIWSPNSTSTSSYLDDDFRNGYGVPGLPSSGLTQTRGL